MASAAQAESLLPGVKTLVPEAFKGSMDGETIPNFINYFELYLSLIFISNSYIQALFIVRLL